MMRLHDNEWYWKRVIVTGGHEWRFGEIRLSQECGTLLDKMHPSAYGKYIVLTKESPVPSRRRKLHSIIKYIRLARVLLIKLSRLQAN